MAYWLGDFRSSFFRHWERCGLAPPLLDGSSPAPEPESQGTNVAGFEPPGPLSETATAAVHDFGVRFGEWVASAMGFADEPAVVARAQWCGRFNLGISLFDYIFDELPDEKQTLLAMPAFAPFTGRPSEPIPPSPSAVTMAVHELAAGVLTDLAVEIGRPTASRRRSGLWKAMFEMFGAQVALSADPLSAPLSDAKVAHVRDLMRMKSAEPFRVMAEWMTLGGSATERRRARELGRAAGACFWMIDDACDAWVDLDTASWNHFLVEAVRRDPTLRFTSNDLANPVLDARIGRVWTHWNVADEAAAAVCDDLATALRRAHGRHDDGDNPDVTDRWTADSRDLAHMIAGWLG